MKFGRTLAMCEIIMEHVSKGETVLIACFDPSEKIDLYRPYLPAAKLEVVEGGVAVSQMVVVN